jgi:type I restriction enzyme, R subunit
MIELHLQDRFLIPFIVEGLGYKEVKANTISNSLIIEEDLEAFISGTKLNAKPYQKLLRKYGGDKDELLKDLIALIQERSASSRNMALFLNTNKSVTLQGIKLHLFYPADSVMLQDDPFEENIFSVVQELPYKYNYQGKKIFAFRPDIVFFLNGIYLGYSELKSNYSNQNARKNGRGKVIKDYAEAVCVYQEYFGENNKLSDKEKDFYRKDFLKIFERAIHLTATDIGETYIIRNISGFFDEISNTCRAREFDREKIAESMKKVFKAYPLLNPDVEKKEKLKEIFGYHYGKAFIEKEILYYNFIEREIQKIDGSKSPKGEGRMIAPRPKQKFGTDKILAKIDEFLLHENDDDYFVAQLEKQLAGVSESIKKDLIEKRKKYANNKNVYSLLMQYAAGFGKSNIIGWSALQLKDLRRDGEYIYDKIMIVVDRLQLRSQIDSKMFNMNIDKGMYVEANNRKTFQDALESDIRLVIVNLQKFGSVREMLNAEGLQKLAKLRIVFLIDEIHRSHSGEQSEEMMNIFDELQTSFDKDKAYNQKRSKKNLIIGFTATPTDNALARFGEFSGYAESEKLWVPFDSYTMQEAIADGYIHSPIENIVPVASKMIFGLPRNELAGFVEPDYRDIEKKQIYENPDRMNAISAYVADLLVKDVYRQIWGQGKAMLAVYSIKAAIAYKEYLTEHFNEVVQEKKYQKYADAPIYIVYSDSQDKRKASSLNDGMSEEKVLESFSLAKNGIIIVVDKLQTGFDERKLHTLFLDKEVKGINAIQTISRVNRTIKNKKDCKIVDFSYNNVNVQNIKDAFEHYSNIVVSDFDPFSDAKVLDMLYDLLKKSNLYQKFFSEFRTIFKSKAKREDPESYLDLTNGFEKFINANPKRAKDAKVKAAQYFTILNRIEYVIILDKKYSRYDFLLFFQKFNIIYNMLNRSTDLKDPIEVYFDNQIGMIEVETTDTKEKKKKETKLAEAKAAYDAGYQYAILAIIEARNEKEEQVGVLIEEFQIKIEAFFEHIKNSKEGQRLIDAPARTAV